MGTGVISLLKSEGSSKKLETYMSKYINLAIANGKGLVGKKPFPLLVPLMPIFDVCSTSPPP